MNETAKAIIFSNPKPIETKMAEIPKRKHAFPPNSIPLAINFIEIAANIPLYKPKPSVPKNISINKFIPIL